MSWMRRIAVLAMILGAGAPLTGCAPRGSSFETLGVPAPEVRPGRTPVIFGWAREDRGGWVLRRVRIDDRTRNEWNPDTQQPVVLYLSPGEHEVRLNAAQLSDPNDPESRARRRYRVRPFTLDLLEGEAQLCVLRVEGDERRRPRARCETYDRVDVQEPEDEYDEYGDEYAEDEDEIAEEPIEEPPAEPVQEAEAPAEAPAEEAPAEAPAEEGSGIPSPFGAAAAAAPPPTPAPAPAPAPVEEAPAEAGDAASSTPPRRLSVEERIERLERLVEELRREIRNR